MEGDIGQRAFDFCTSMDSAVFPKMEGTVNAQAFKDCVKMNRIVLPLVQAIGDPSAFIHCTRLGEQNPAKNVVFKAEVWGLGANALDISDQDMGISGGRDTAIITNGRLVFENGKAGTSSDFYNYNL